MHYFRKFLIFAIHVQYCPYNFKVKEIKYLQKNKPDDHTYINKQV